MDSLQALFPLFSVVAGALLIMLLEVAFKRENKTYLAFVSLISLILCAYFAVRSWNQDLSYFNGHLALDNVALLFSLILIVSTAFVTLISMKYLTLQDTNHGEYYALLLLALSGMLIMVSSQDFLSRLFGFFSKGRDDDLIIVICLFRVYRNHSSIVERSSPRAAFISR